MAFGMEIFGKLFLTSFRLIAIVLIIWYVLKIAGKGFPKGYLVALALIIAGAAAAFIFFTDFLEVAAIAAVSANEDVLVCSLEDERSPKCFVALEASP